MHINNQALNISNRHTDYSEPSYANTTIIKKCYGESLGSGTETSPNPPPTFEGKEISLNNSLFYIS